MSGGAGGTELVVAQHAAVARVIARWAEHHGWAASAVGASDVELVEVEVLRAGRPGLWDVVARVGDRLAHAVLGLRRPGTDLRVLGSVDEPVLGTLEDEAGIALVVDAVHEADCARALLDAVAGDRVPPASVVTVVRADHDEAVLGFDRRCSLSVFSWLAQGPHPGTAMLAALDEAGFNHVRAPIAFWRRAGHDLGVVQELLTGSTGGWALALTSLRDVLTSGLSPDVAGGDFAPESFALGTMAARMHIALAHAFGRRAGDAALWAGAAERALGDVAEPLADTLAHLRQSALHPPAVRAHGDLHLGRTARTDHGWVLADCMPGGVPAGGGDPVFRSPLADVADLTWSLGRAAAVVAAERGPGAPGAREVELASAWEARNRRALVASYLATPGIGGLVPADRRVVRRLLSMFEAMRAAGAPLEWAAVV